MVRLISMIAFMFVVTPAFAFAQGAGVQGRWSVTFAGGAAVPASGALHEGGSGTVLGLPTSVDEKAFNDVYDKGIGWSAGVGYGVARNVEVFGGVNWYRASGEELSVGTVAGLDLRAQFADYTSLGFDGGVRVHFAPGARVNPYVAAVAGFRRVDAIPATFRVPAAGVTLADTPFYDESTVPVFGGDVGLLFAVSSNVFIGVESGLRYHTKLSDLEGLAGTGLENLNDVGSRWSVPVSAVFRVGF